MAPCPYSTHRWSDWRLADGRRLVCGVCHPPADRLPAISALDGQPVEPDLRASAHTVEGHLTRIGARR